jgi:hypothetical protein
MSRHMGYDLVRPMFTSGELKAFSDIFNFDLVPKSTVATDLGKEKGRFNQLIKNPNEFNFQEIRKFSGLCNMTPSEMGILIENEHPKSPLKDEQQKKTKYRAIRPMTGERRITLLEQIFDYVTRSEVARKIGRKQATLDRYLKNVDLFSIEDIRAIGGLFDLSLPDILKLVEAQYAKQSNNQSL